MKSAVVFCVHDRVFFLRQAIQSVMNEGFDIKIWDNGSSKPHVVDCLASMESAGFEVVRNAGNNYYDWACKDIWDRWLVEYDFVAIAEDCAIIAAGTLREMERVAFSDDRLGLIGPVYSTGCTFPEGQKAAGIWSRWPQMSNDWPLFKQYDPEVPTTLTADLKGMNNAFYFGDGKELRKLIEYLDPIVWESVHELDQTVFACKKDAYQKVGGYIPRFRYGWPTTCNWGHLMRNIGYHMAIARHTFVLNADHHQELYPRMSRDTEYPRPEWEAEAQIAMSTEYTCPSDAYVRWMSNFVHFGMRKDGAF
jgi:hypothetical protein